MVASPIASRLGRSAPLVVSCEPADAVVESVPATVELVGLGWLLPWARDPTAITTATTNASASPAAVRRRRLICARRCLALRAARD